MATTTPNYGWSVPTSSDYVAQGAVAIETLGDSADATLFTALGGAYPGLRLIKKQTIGSAVASIAVTDVFSATYTSYLIKIEGQNASGVDAIQMQLRNAGGNLTDANYNFTGIERAATGAIVNRGSIAATSFRIGTSASATAGAGFSIGVDITNPFLTRWTMGYAEASAAEPTNGIIWNEAAFSYTTTTSTTGFNLFQAAGTTFTNGTIYVYGYGAS
jgi:hypothetical protein